ncbi:MAG: tetratricopeptide repeat protein, partial [Panacibacter sp.]
MKRKNCHVKPVVLIFSVLFFHCVNAQTSIKNISESTFQKADSLYYAQEWKAASKMYEQILGDTSQNSIAWNRLGFSNYNLGNYDKALRCYQNALAFHPILPVKAAAYSRMARVYALQNNKTAAVAAIDSALNAGYINLSELDTLKDFS